MGKKSKLSKIFLFCDNQFTVLINDMKQTIVNIHMMTVEFKKFKFDKWRCLKDLKRQWNARWFIK